MAHGVSIACGEPIRAAALVAAVVAPRRGLDGDDSNPTTKPSSGAHERTLDAKEGAAGPEERALARRFARVLVVDDDEGVRRQLCYLLEDEGYDVEVAASGAAALAVAAASSFDVVILDVRLPDVSGIEVFEAFRRRSEMVKTIIVSGFLVDEEIAAAEGRGAHFLAKPVDSDRLLRLLARLELDRPARVKGDTP